MLPPSWLLGRVLSNGAAPRVAQEANAAAPRRLPDGLSQERSFLFPEDENGTVRPTRDRGEMAAGLGRGARVLGPESAAGNAPEPGQALRPRAAALPVGNAPHGPHARLHARRRPRALPAAQWP